MDAHHRKLERMYLSAPINAIFRPSIAVSEGAARIEAPVRPELFHAAHALHGAAYFKALDDAAWFAVASLVEDVFVLTASYQVHLLRPVSSGTLVAEGRVVHASRTLWLADAELRDGDGHLVARGSGSFVRGRTHLGPEVGYT